MKITKLRQGCTLSPRLQEVLELVYAKRPLLEYEVTKYSDNNYAESVRVWQDGQKIGEIHARYNRYSPSKGCSEIWYAVESDNIKKQRGERDRKYCKDAKVAARVAIEVFTKKPLSELGKRLIADVKSSVESLQDRATYDYRNQMGPISVLEVANYLTDVHMGKTVPLPEGISKHIVSKDILRKRENHEIAVNVHTHAKNNNGYAIKVMQDETLLFVHMNNSDTTSKCQSTYELDQYTQEKFAMLKLLDPFQFAADIGVKYERDDGENKQTIYFIVAGETKVM